MILTACGGGSDSKGSFRFCYKGPLSGATVFADIMVMDFRSSNEPFANNADGSYTLNCSR